MMPNTFLRYEEHTDYWSWSRIAADHSFAVHILAKTGSKGLFGGIEEHRKPRDGEKIDHSVCPFLNGPCCHDGSATEWDEYRWSIELAINDRDMHRIFTIVSRVFERRWNHHQRKASRAVD